MKFLLIFLFFWANQVIQTYANDTLGPDNDSLEVWILNKPSLSAQYELVEHYWRLGRYQDALNLIQSIPVIFKLEGRQLDKNVAYEQFKTLLYNAYQNGRTEANLEKIEVEGLKEIAIKEIGFASVQAGNILQFFYGTAYLYYPVLPNKGKKARRYNPPTEEVEIPVLNVPKIWGYPNPAINWSDILYDLPDGMQEGTLIVTSTAGQTIETIKITQNSGTITLNTSNWSPGIYFAVLFSDKTKSNVYKLVIRK